MELNEIQLKEYTDFLKSHPKGHIMQSPEWAKLKDNWINEIIIHKDNNGKIKGSMSLLIRKIPFLNKTLIYCPRGPVCDLDDFDTLSALLEKAKPIAKKYNSYVLKMDPDVVISNEVFANNLKKLGFKNKSSSKNFEGIQPRFVFRLNIKDKTEEEVQAIFHQKTRYNIKVALKKGVTSQIASRSDIAEFHKIMLETGIRDQFVIRNQEYFEKMYDCFAPNNLRLYAAYFEGKMIAGTLALYYGNKVWYLYGASSNAYRNVMPNYLLQWEMIKWAIENKCEIYDFRGVSGDLDENNPLYGLYKFKKGFNGDFTEFIGELDYIFNSFIYHSVEKGEKIFRETRRKLFVLKNKK